jgi:hypothetical protein
MLLDGRRTLVPERIEGECVLLNRPHNMHIYMVLSMSCQALTDSEQSLFIANFLPTRTTLVLRHGLLHETCAFTTGAA